MRDSLVAEKNQLDVIKPLAKEKFICLASVAPRAGVVARHLFTIKLRYINMEDVKEGGTFFLPGC
jgi:hypothetical protein